MKDKLLAEFVEEALAGLGVLDDVDELLRSIYQEDGEELTRETMERYNHAIAFANQFRKKKDQYDLITEKDFQQYTRVGL